MARLPEWAKDAIFNSTGFHFSVTDRLRLLAGWTLHLDTQTATEELPGRTEVNLSRIWFEKPKWLPQPKRQGYEEVNTSG